MLGRYMADKFWIFIGGCMVGASVTMLVLLRDPATYGTLSVAGSVPPNNAPFAAPLTPTKR